MHEMPENLGLAVGQQRTDVSIIGPIGSSKCMHAPCHEMHSCEKIFRRHASCEASCPSGEQDHSIGAGRIGGEYKHASAWPYRAQAREHRPIGWLIQDRDLRHHVGDGVLERGAVKVGGANVYSAILAE